MTDPVRFDPNAPLVIVDGELRGPAGRIALQLVLDTGTSQTILDTSIVEELYDLDDAPRSRILVEGRAKYVPRVEVESIRALGIERRQFPLLASEIPACTGTNGRLGLDFLRGSKLVIDFDAGEITLD